MSLLCMLVRPSLILSRYKISLSEASLNCIINTAVKNMVFDVQNEDGCSGLRLQILGSGIVAVHRVKTVIQEQIGTRS